MCVARIFVSGTNPDFYAKSRSLYAKLSVLRSKWPDFYSKFNVPVSAVPTIRCGGELWCLREPGCKNLVGRVDSNG